jgi:hypothetical protein
MQNVARVSQSDAIDSGFGTLCPHEQQSGKRHAVGATSPPQSGKLSLTNDARVAAFRGLILTAPTANDGN